MAKEKRVKMYNKGNRHWTLKDNGVEVKCAPGKSVELNESQTAKFVKNYPHDFLAGEPVQKSNDSKKLKAEVVKLTAENEALRDKVAEFEAEKKDRMEAKANSIPVKNTELSEE